MLIPGAAAASVYTVSTINNAFDPDYNAFFGTFGSHVSVIILLIFGSVADVFMDDNVNDLAEHHTRSSWT